MKRNSRKVFVGEYGIGGDAPVTIQSMLNTKTTDIAGSIKQIESLKAVGCDLIRLAVPDEPSAAAFGEIVKQTKLPLIADIHYNYKLAHLALDNGAKKIRMNPGNMSDFAQIKELAEHMLDLGVPVRVGVNGGSLNPKYKNMSEVDALCASALDCADVFEKCHFKDVVIAVKASDTMTMIESNRRLASMCDYPLHIGVTEAGTARSGLIKSAFGIGTLLNEGIGDTIRVSLSADPVEEVIAAKTLLRTLKIRNEGVEVVACPTCARTEIDVAGLAGEVEKLTANIKVPLKISVLGCPLNGIGEGEKSDLGIAGGKEKSLIMKHGKILETVDSHVLLPHFMEILQEELSKNNK